jgi:hypothetical protein
VGYKLAEDAERYAPDSLTFRERYLLSVLAHAARDDDEARTCPLGFANDPDIRQRCRLGRRCFYDVLRALVKKGALIHVKRGHKGATAIYRIARFNQSALNVHPNDLDSVREIRSEGAGSPAIGCEFDGYRVRESPTPIQSSGYQNPDLIALVKDEIKTAIGADITDELAGRIMSDLITASRQPVKIPAAYLKKAIRGERDPRSRWLPRATQAQPPPFERSEDKGIDPDRIGNILSANPRIREMRQMRQSDGAEGTESAEAAT